MVSLSKLPTRGPQPLSSKISRKSSSQVEPKRMCQSVLSPTIWLPCIMSSIPSPCLSRMCNATASSRFANIGFEIMRRREFARIDHKLNFNVTPKMHKLQHLHLYARILNPRWVQNYAEESLIGTTTTIWQKSIRGNYSDHVQENVVLKRTVGLLLRLEL